MEEGRTSDSPERIEVELTGHAPPGHRRRWRHAEPSRPISWPVAPSAVRVTGGTTLEAPPSRATERRRLAATALTVGALGLSIGVAIGRAGAPGGIDAGEGNPTDTMSPLNDEPSGETGIPVPPVAAADLPSAYRASASGVDRRPPTSATEGWVDDTIDVDRRLASAGVELIALTLDGVMTISLSDGARSTYSTPTRAPAGRRDRSSPGTAGSSSTTRAWSAPKYSNAASPFARLASADSPKSSTGRVRTTSKSYSRRARSTARTCGP